MKNLIRMACKGYVIGAMEKNRSAGWWYVVKRTDVIPNAENIAEELKRIARKLKENEGEEFVNEATGR